MNIFGAMQLISGNEILVRKLVQVWLRLIDTVAMRLGDSKISGGRVTFPLLKKLPMGMMQLHCTEKVDNLAVCCQPKLCYLSHWFLTQRLNQPTWRLILKQC